MRIISAAEAAGHVRVAEMNRQVAGDLDKIIAAFENEEPDDKGAAAGAAFTRSPRPPPGSRADPAKTVQALRELDRASAAVTSPHVAQAAEK